jgi:hypothetical protein
MKTLVIIAFILVYNTVFSQNDFRNVKWGMTISEVKKNETAKLEDPGTGEEPKIVAYSTKVNNLDVYVLYFFFRDKDNIERLVRTGYGFNEEHFNQNDYINDYHSVKKILIEKYGTPNIDKEIWRNDMYKDKRENWGFAVSLGHLVYVCQWVNKGTSISLGLSGDNMKIKHGMEYKGLDWEYLEKNAKAKKNKKDF